MPTTWSILYRGPLASCNYACGYCPFAKHPGTRAQLAADQAALRRFAAWVASRAETIRLLFTPWGEALVHRHYQEVLAHLSHRPNVARVAIQTNLSGRLDWAPRANPATLAFWCTFHPTQTTLARFLAQCRRLDQLGFRYSVGVVGVREVFDLLEPLRAGLRREVYLWVNAFKRLPVPYTPAEIARLTQFDPLFPLTLHPHPSQGRPCHTGHTVFSVDGAGDIRRCHFVKPVLGNIYHADFPAALQPRPCPAPTCACHIGYAHLEPLRLDLLFGPGLLERALPPGSQAVQLSAFNLSA